MLALFMTAAVTSAWAADYLVRSGRGLLVRAGCYAELYLSAAALAAAGILFAVFAWVVLLDTSPSTNKPPLWPFAALALAAAGTAVAWAGVVRRWHPAARVAVYAACLAAVYGVFSQNL